MKNFLKIQKCRILGWKLKRYIAIDGKLYLLTFTEINTSAVTVASTLTLTIDTNKNQYKLGYF